MKDRRINHELTENNKSLLGRVRFCLGFWVSILVDAIANVYHTSDGREIRQPPCPPQGTESAFLGGL
jgi:hypothetical protein